jgi:lysophospholipase L1-like esterase
MLCLALLASLVMNLTLFRHAKSFYVQMQAVRLDPMGERAHSRHSVHADHKRGLVVIAGDSRAADWPSPERAHGYQFANRAVGNQTTVQILGRHQNDVLVLNPDIVILQAGVNDLKSIPLFPDRKNSIISDCKTNLQQIVSLCTKSDINVIVTTVFPVGVPSLQRRHIWSDDVVASVQEVNAFVRSLSETNVIVLDSYSLLCGDDNLLKGEYFTDTLHLNKDGYDILNEELEKILETMQGTAQQNIGQVSPEGAPSSEPSM